MSLQTTRPARPDPLDGHAASLLLTALRSTAVEAREAVRAGFATLERFVDALNRHDTPGWAATLNYPHVRFAGGQVQLWPDAQSYVRDNDIAAFADTGWSRTRWDRILPIQAGIDKVHFAVRFTRLDRHDEPITSYDAVYVVTFQHGHWGVQARSTYAGITLRDAAF